MDTTISARILISKEVPMSSGNGDRAWEVYDSLSLQDQKAVLAEVKRVRNRSFPFPTTMSCDLLSR
jgi:hypothetical protein